MPKPSMQRNSSMTKNPLVVGLTGNIGAGKSTVLAYFSQFPSVVILDADKLAHQAMSPDGLAFGPIVEHFGKEILADDGTIHRPSLGKIVFADPAQLSKLEELTHPAVFQLAQSAIVDAASRGVRLVLLEAIKLLDGGTTAQLCDEVWVVTIDKSSQYKRLYEQRNMDKESIQERLNAQSTQEYKVSKADRVIENSGTLEDLHSQLAQLWAEIS